MRHTPRTEDVQGESERQSDQNFLKMMSGSGKRVTSQIRPHYVSSDRPSTRKPNQLTFLVLLGRDPHPLEGAEAREDAAADPGRVLTFRRRADADLGFPQGQLLRLVQ